MSLCKVLLILNFRSKYKGKISKPDLKALFGSIWSKSLVCKSVPKHRTYLLRPMTSNIIILVYAHKHDNILRKILSAIDLAFFFLP